MGRNAGAQIRWSHSNDPTNHTATWYCQQHAKFGQGSGADLNSFSSLTQHIINDHGIS